MALVEYAAMLLYFGTGVNWDALLQIIQSMPQEIACEDVLPQLRKETVGWHDEE
jgi:hypothetical protein